MASYTYIDSSATDFAAASHTSSSSPTQTASLGALWTPGDLALAFLAVDATGTNSATISDGGTGWSDLGQAVGSAVFGGSTTPAVHVWAKFLQVSNPDPTVTSMCATGTVFRPFCGVLIYRGPTLFGAVSLTTAGSFDAGERHPASGSNLNVTKTSTTNTVGAADTLLVRVYMATTGGGADITFAADASETERLEHSRNPLAVMFADELWSSASDYPARTAVATPSSSDTIGWGAGELVPNIDQIITGGSGSGDAWAWTG